MVSTAPTPSTVQVQALIADAYDGTVRLLNDVQRMGLALLKMTMQGQGQGQGQRHGHDDSRTVTLLLMADRPVDAGSLQSRLERHPCVNRVTVMPLDTETMDPAAMAKAA